MPSVLMTTNTMCLLHAWSSRDIAIDWMTKGSKNWFNQNSWRIGVELLLEKRSEGKVVPTLTEAVLRGGEGRAFLLGKMGCGQSL
jgi:hypothetical protein